MAFWMGYIAWFRIGTPGHQHWSEMVNEAFGLRNAGYNGFLLHKDTGSIFFWGRSGFFITNLDCEYIWYVADTFAGSLPVLRGEQDLQGPCRPSGEVFDPEGENTDPSEYEKHS
jgi:hypothetical protein